MANRKASRWQQSSPEARQRRVAANRKWREKNRDKTRAWGKRYYDANVEARRATSRFYHKRNRQNPEYLKRMRARNKAARLANPEHHFYARLKTTYGLTREQHDALVKQQGNVCAACGQPERTKMRGKTKRLSVDHCHKTGKVRGLLCGHCNAGLGHFFDSPKLLRRIATWIESQQ